MPLEAGKSKKVFEHNLKTELAAGKPKAQALAISYSKQRESKGGSAKPMKRSGRGR